MEGAESFLLISAGTAAGSSVTREMQTISLRGSIKGSTEDEAEGRLLVGGEEPDHSEELEWLTVKAGLEEEALLKAPEVSAGNSTESPAGIMVGALNDRWWLEISCHQ